MCFIYLFVKRDLVACEEKDNDEKLFNHRPLARLARDAEVAENFLFLLSAERAESKNPQSLREG
jgi:hypothetical protein